MDTSPEWRWNGCVDGDLRKAAEFSTHCVSQITVREARLLAANRVIRLDKTSNQRRAEIIADFLSDADLSFEVWSEKALRRLSSRSMIWLKSDTLRVMDFSSCKCLLELSCPMMTGMGGSLIRLLSWACINPDVANIRTRRNRTDECRKLMRRFIRPLWGRNEMTKGNSPRLSYQANGRKSMHQLNFKPALAIFCQSILSFSIVPPCRSTECTYWGIWVNLRRL